MSISLLDSTELNNNLSLISDTIKQKINNNEQLSFPSNFIERLNTLYTIDDWFDLNKPEGDIYYTSNWIENGLLLGRKKINNFFGENLTNLGASCLSSNSIKIIVLPKCHTLYTGSLSSCSSLLTADFGGTPTSGQGFIRDTSFFGNTKMTTLILRGNTVWTLSYISTLNNTPFASGKAGGTLYVPRAQIENYKAATNWSTILSYTKSDGETLQNQILPIEDSIYYTQYADGTLLPDTKISSTGKEYLPKMEINVSKDRFRTVPEVLDTYGNMEDLEELTLTGTIKSHSTGALLGVAKTFSNTKFPKLKKLYIQPTIFKNEAGTVTKEYGGCGHYVFSETNLTELVIGRQGGPYFSGGGYFRQDLPCPPGTDSYQVGSLDGLTITVYTNQYSASAGFMLSPAPNTTVICKDYLTGEILTPPTE